MGKETLRIMDRYHQNKKRLNVLYEDKMVLENKDFVKTVDYTNALKNEEIFAGGKIQKCDKKTSLSDKILRLIKKKNYVNFEINILKTEIQLINNVIKVLEAESKKEEFIVFKTKHIEKKSIEATSVICEYSINGCWKILNKIEAEFERLNGNI